MKTVNSRKRTIQKSNSSLPGKISLFKSLIDTGANRDWVMESLQKEGPPHKKLQNALLLSTLDKFVKSIETNYHTKFEAQKGFTLMGYDEEETWEFPVSLPKETLRGKEGINKVLKRFAEGPVHETLMYATLLQVLTWANKIVKK